MGKNKAKKNKKQNRKASSNKHAKHQHQQKGKKWRKQQRKHGSDWDRHFKEFQDKINKIGLFLRDIDGDGNCLFRAVADQVEGIQKNYKVYRELATQFLLEQEEYFAPFIEDDQTFQEYVKDMQDDGTWGGHLELQALSMGLEINFVLHLIDRPAMVIRNNFKKDSRVFHLAYHLGENIGEHYSSVRLATDIGFTPAMQIKHIYYEEIFLQNNSDFSTLERYQQEKLELMQINDDNEDTGEDEGEEEEKLQQNQENTEKLLPQNQQKIENVGSGGNSDGQEEEAKLNDEKVIEYLKNQNNQINENNKGLIQQQILQEQQEQPQKQLENNTVNQNINIEQKKQLQDMTEDERFLQEQIEMINFQCQQKQDDEEEFLKQQIEMINKAYENNDAEFMQNAQLQIQQQEIQQENKNQNKIQQQKQNNEKNQGGNQQINNNKNYPRNKKCYCGSKQKYKNCCFTKDLEKDKIQNPELFLDQQNNIQIDKSQISDKVIIA